MTVSLKQYWDLLARHIRPQKGRFAVLTLALLTSIGLQLASPQIMRAFIDSALGGQALNTLLWTAVAFMAVAITQQVVSVAVTYIGESVAWTATNALRAELAWHCLNLDMGFHNDHTPGQLIERIDGDVTEMANFFSQFVVMIVGNGLLLVGVLIALSFENWIAGIAFTLFAIVALFAMMRLRNIAVPYQKGRREGEANLYGFLEEQLAATEDVRSSGAVDFSLRELVRLQSTVFKYDWRAHQKGWIIGNVTGGLLTFGNLMAILAGYFLFIGGNVTLGTVFLFIRYVSMLEGPLWNLTHEMEKFQTIGACVERLAELRKVQSRVSDEGQSVLPDGPLPLIFDGVTFAYYDQLDEPVLNDLNFAIQPGKVLGLLGRTGSGKTTLTRLIYRLYDPTSGSIHLDGSDLRAARLESLRHRVAVVTQDVQLFRASIRDNLTFFDRSISDAQIQQVIAELELGDWFGSLPNGLDTQLDTGGHSLSAGEAQLLALTRVFLRNPGLIILDEASSRLDPVTEQRIERAIDRLLKNRTAIIIAHRLNTVHRADEIMILEDGRVFEYGPRTDLARDPDSRFYHLLQTGLEEVLV